MKQRYFVCGCLFWIFHLCASLVISVDDPNWYFTEYNWYIDPSGEYAQSANPGAYFKVGVIGTTQIGLMIHQNAAPFQPYLNIRYSVDNKPYQQETLVSPSNTIQLADSLNSSLSHQLILYILNSDQKLDRWKLGPSNILAVIGLLVDSGTTTIAPILRPKRILTFWDSIGEGVKVLGNSGDDLIDNDSTATWAMVLASALNAEISMVGFGRQGYNVTGNGNVPALYTPGSDKDSAWNKYDAQHSRLGANGQLVPNPHFIFCGHGTNDGLRSSDENVYQSAMGWMIAQRKASPTSKIFVVIPFGRFMADAITSAFQDYQKNEDDQYIFLLDLGTEGAIGLDRWGPSLYSSDGIHPLAIRDGQLGALLAASAITECLLDNDIILMNT